MPTLAPTDLWERCSQLLRRKDSTESFERVFSERRRRMRQRSSISTIYWEVREGEPAYYPFKPPAGSITLYWAAAGSDTSAQLRGAFLDRDVDALQELHDRLAEEWQAREMRSVREAVSSMFEAPSFFDVRYSGATLAQNLWLDESAEVGSIVFPFNGGRLDPDAFSIVEYMPNPLDPSPRPLPDPVPEPIPSPPYPPIGSHRWDTFLVVAEPALSPLERRVLSAITADQIEINVAPSGTILATPTALVTVVVFVTINTAVTTCCATFHDRLAEVSLPTSYIRRSGPALSAAALLDLRAEIFDEFAVR